MIKRIFLIIGFRYCLWQGILATGTIKTYRLGKELKLKKKRLRRKLKGTIKCHYENYGIGMIYWNDNGPVKAISNFHTDLSLTTVKDWNISSRNHIRTDRPPELQNIVSIWVELILLMPWSGFIKLMYVVKYGTDPIASTLLTPL